MTGAVSSVVNTVGKILDPGGLLGIGKEPEQAPIIESETGLSDAEKANLAATEAKRKKAKAKSGTKTVLTSPLGAAETAQTAVTKLGGA